MYTLCGRFAKADCKTNIRHSRIIPMNSVVDLAYNIYYLFEKDFSSIFKYSVKRLVPANDI